MVRDVLKLTAQFMARNGRQFMTGLSQRESRNYQFDFLRPNHSLFPFFTKLVDHYTKVFAPSKAIKDTLYTNASDKSKVCSQFFFSFSLAFAQPFFFFISRYSYGS